MADPCPHTSLRQKYARVQVKVGGEGSVEYVMV